MSKLTEVWKSSMKRQLKSLSFGKYSFTKTSSNHYFLEFIEYYNKIYFEICNISNPSDDKTKMVNSITLPIEIWPFFNNSLERMKKVFPIDGTGMNFNFISLTQSITFYTHLPFAFHFTDGLYFSF